MTETLDRVKQIIATLFNVEEGSLTPDSSPASIPAWDSMGQLMLILELEQQFDTQIPPERGEKLQSVSQIVEFVDSLS